MNRDQAVALARFLGEVSRPEWGYHPTYAAINRAIDDHPTRSWDEVAIACVYCAGNPLCAQPADFFADGDHWTGLDAYLKGGASGRYRSRRAREILEAAERDQQNKGAPHTPWRLILEQQQAAERA